MNKKTEYKLSVAIITTDFDGKGLGYLKRLLDSILTQEFHDFEIIISDQGGNSQFLDLINDLDLPSCTDIKYFVSDATNASGNINFAISKCSSEFIKIMFMDDFLYSKNALEKFYQVFVDGANWIAAGQTHWDEVAQHYFNDMIPSWNDEIIDGKNTIGNPSVIAFKNNGKLKFDTGLLYLCDTDFYQSLKHTYGEPHIINEYLIATTANNQGYSHNFTNQDNFDEILKKELERTYENRYYTCPDCKKNGISCAIPR
jgi:glycosyltransferase involved in cell wall biosynthesis